MTLRTVFVSVVRVLALHCDEDSVRWNYFPKATSWKVHCNKALVHSIAVPNVYSPKQCGARMLQGVGGDVLGELQVSRKVNKLTNKDQGAIGKTMNRLFGRLVEFI